jgi:hypothetical protein
VCKALSGGNTPKHSPGAEQEGEGGGGGGGSGGGGEIRGPSFGVAAVAAAAEDEGGSGDGGDGFSGGGSGDESPIRVPGARTSAFTAFSTPLRGAMTPARRGARGMTPPLAAAPEPLPARFVRQPPPGRAAAPRSLALLSGVPVRTPRTLLPDLATRYRTV